MTQQQLNEFAQRRGLTCMGPTLVGAWRGYPFMATLRPGRVNVLNVSFTYLRGPAPKKLRQARKTMPRGCALSWAQNRVNLVCSARDEQMEGLIEAGMDAVTGLLRSCSTVLSDTCPLCRRGSCDALALVNGGYVPAHQSCCENHSHDAVARAEVNSQQGNYVTGWLGALLGGMVGAIPTILLAILAERITVWLCLLIPLAAYYGYKLLRGRMDRMATVATVVSSLFQVFVMEQVIFYTGIVSYLGIWPSVPASVAYYFEVMDPGDMAADMAMPLLFVILGIACVFGIIKRTNQTVTIDAGAMLDSMTDLNGAPLPRPEPAYAAQPAQTYQPVQPVQPTQTYQPAQPVQPTQTYQPAQPVQTAQTYQPVQPVQTAQPAQPVQLERPSQTSWGGAPQWDRPAEPVSPEPEPSAPAAPDLPTVAPLDIKLPDLPDLPETPTLGGGEQK